MLNSLRHTSFFLACIVIGYAPSLRADELSLVAARDTTLYETPTSYSNGKGRYFFVGRNGRHSARRALIAFDVAGALPAGAKVKKATLTLTMSRGQTRPNSVNLYRITGPWGEGVSLATGEEGGGAPASDGDATWTHRVWPSILWSVPGGDFEALVRASSTVLDQGSYGWSSAELTADVQDFLDHPQTNNGWILVADQDPAASSKRFNGHDNLVGAGPTLRVSYDPPQSATGACCLGNGACGISPDPGTDCQGTYLGSGSTCEKGACPEVQGACCMPDVKATCEVRPRSQCYGGSWQGGLTSCERNPCPVVLTPFLDPLPLPVVATPIRGTAGGAASYEMRMVQVKQRLHSELPPTTVWGFHDGTNGGYPGPTIEARTGSPVQVTWVNDLRDEDGQFLKHHPLSVDHCLHGAGDDTPRTVVHLHGGHVPASSDGNPEEFLLPGQRVSYEYPNQQRAATIWYHDHALGITRLNVVMGLAGFYLIRDDEEEALGLPSGKYEIPLVIQDRSFNPDGSLLYPAKWQESVFGNALLVNGKVYPYLTVDRGQYRFRILNGSTSRTYSLSLSDGRPIVQIGNDGGLLKESFVAHVTIAPGERADVLLDFQFSAKEVILKNTARSPFPNGGSGPDLPEVMKFVVDDKAGYTDPIPVKQVALPTLSESEAILSRDFVLEKALEDHCGAEMWTINGKEWGAITERPHLGTTEVWRFVNRSGVTHPMHIHSLFFQVLDRQNFKIDGDENVLQGSPTRPDFGDRGWKDTVQVGPLEVVRVIARFEDFAGRFPYHCHLLEHEDHGMMRQFEAIAVCGDGAVARGFETCDDGNTIPGDGCSPSCQTERDEPGAAGGSAGAAGAGEQASAAGAPIDVPVAPPTAEDAGEGCSCGIAPRHADAPFSVSRLLVLAGLGLTARRTHRARARLTSTRKRD